MTPKEQQTVTSAPATVTLPSADLINFRFNKIDENQLDTNRVLAETNKKLDKIMVQNARLITEERAQQLINDATNPIYNTINGYRNWAVAVFTASVGIFT